MLISQKMFFQHQIFQLVFAFAIDNQLNVKGFKVEKGAGCKANIGFEATRFGNAKLLRNICIDANSGIVDEGNATEIARVDDDRIGCE